MAPVREKMHGAGTTGSAGHTRPSLRNGLTAYSALSPVTGLCCHRRPARRQSVFADLAPALGRQDHAAWPAARPRSPALRKRMLRCLAATAPRLHVRDDRDTPLLTRRDGREDAADLPDTPSGIFLT